MDGTCLAVNCKGNEKGQSQSHTLHPISQDILIIFLADIKLILDSGPLTSVMLRYEQFYTSKA